MAKKKQGSFFTGLVIGLLAGSTSYFLFTTQQGQALRQQLEHEWDKIKKKLPQDKLELEDLDLAELADLILNKADQFKVDFLGLTESSTSAKSPKRPKLLQSKPIKLSKEKTDQPDKFKGV